MREFLEEQWNNVRISKTIDQLVSTLLPRASSNEIHRRYESKHRFAYERRVIESYALALFNLIRCQYISALKFLLSREVGDELAGRRGHPGNKRNHYCQSPALIRPLIWSANRWTWALKKPQLSAKLFSNRVNRLSLPSPGVKWCKGFFCDFTTPFKVQNCHARGDDPHATIVFWYQKR